MKSVMDDDEPTGEFFVEYVGNGRYDIIGGPANDEDAAYSCPLEFAAFDPYVGMPLISAPQLAELEERLPALTALIAMLTKERDALAATIERRRGELRLNGRWIVGTVDQLDDPIEFMAGNDQF